jgi:D-glycero-alpha-D-manno-heptose-7-phosphate kinase
MIISRTPLRVSFVGGGTDIKEYYKHEDGMVLSTSIDKYIYVAVKRQYKFVDFKFRINWSKTEFCNKIEDIEHPIVREALIMLNIDYPIEITTFADVPSGTGLGSSSTFAVGLLHALYALKGEMVTKWQLANQAAKIEIEILKRNIGKQDHFAAAYGKLNVFKFHKDDKVTVEPVFYQNDIKNEIEESLIMFYTRETRDASLILKSQIKNTQNKFKTLSEMKDLVNPLRQIFNEKKNISDFGKILHHGWMLKKSITSDISNTHINGYYDIAIQAGALGGKLLGAGGGGFLLFFAEKSNHDNIRKSLSNLFEMKFKFDEGGSRITYYDQNINY